MMIFLSLFLFTIGSATFGRSIRAFQGHGSTQVKPIMEGSLPSSSSADPNNEDNFTQIEFLQASTNQEDTSQNQIMINERDFTTFSSPDAFTRNRNRNQFPFTESFEMNDDSSNYDVMSEISEISESLKKTESASTTFESSSSYSSMPNKLRRLPSLRVGSKDPPPPFGIFGEDSDSDDTPTFGHNSDIGQEYPSYGSLLGESGSFPSEDSSIDLAYWNIHKEPSAYVSDEETRMVMQSHPFVPNFNEEDNGDFLSDAIQQSAFNSRFNSVSKGSRSSSAKRFITRMFRRYHKL
jgi:hypothetical protein